MDVREKMLTDNGWIEYASWQNLTGTPITYFSANWVVPPPPSHSDNQTIIFFPGLQHTQQGPGILQPILRWDPQGVGGGPCWTITNSYTDELGATQNSAAGRRQVNQDDYLQGMMTCTARSGDQFTYKCSFAGFPAVDLIISDIDELLWAFVALEAYGASQLLPLARCGDYPNNNGVKFSVNIRTGFPNPVNANATWETTKRYEACGQGFVISGNGSSTTSITLAYDPNAQAS